MRNFIVEVSADVPYPKTFSTRVQGTTVATCVGKAMRLATKCEAFKGKRVDVWRVKMIKM